MKVRDVFPDQPVQVVDYHDLSSVTTALVRAANELSAMSQAVATARQVKEYNSDLRKRALALAVREHLVKGESATAAETYGRASMGYGEALETLGHALAEADRIIAEYEACRVRWESLRSALSVLKTAAGTL